MENKLRNLRARIGGRSAASSAAHKAVVLDETAKSTIRELMLKFQEGRRSKETTHAEQGRLVVFSGGSGDAKYLASAMIANDLGAQVYRVNLEEIVSRYIGETEKNLEALFANAAQAGSLLFFDEADALFGKRTEVKDSHDRYADIDTEYLLQRIEQYSGVVVLATNSKTDLDERFRARVDAVIDLD